MRTRVLLFFTALCLLAGAFAVSPASAVEAEHPGCRGIGNAQAKASAKGNVALAKVAEKFGCGGTTPPDEVDPFACAADQVSLASWTYNGVLDDPVSTGWTLLDGNALLAGPQTGDHENARGFYWYEAEPNLVQSIVIKSFTGEVVTITDSDAPDHPAFVGDPLPAGHAISQNHLTSRTGIQLVKFCGATA